MAGIAGIYCANGRPADVAGLKRMVAAVEHRGRDGINYWSSGPVAFAHLQFHTTPESMGERQPLVAPSGEVCLAWNGRVDNRAELLRELDIPQGLKPSDFQSSTARLKPCPDTNLNCSSGAKAPGNLREPTDGLKPVPFNLNEPTDALKAVSFNLNEPTDALKAVPFNLNEPAGALKAVSFNLNEPTDALKAVSFKDESDAGLVMAAYLAWGEDCVQHIVGDFALAVWDARQRRLWCARDYVGIRPFYYFWDGKTFLFGPEIRALLAHPAVSLKINEGMAGEYLANAITSRDETLYANIRRLPSGSTLTIDAAGKLSVGRWWRPELSLIEYGTDEEYAEHFRHLFDQSVSARMRSNTPWGIELSGGLDSSSIAVSARAVLDASGAKDDRILTYSMTWPGKPWDESEDIAATVEKARLTAEYVQPLEVGLEFFRERAAYWRDFPGSPNGEPIFLPAATAAKRHQLRVLLCGIGGDEWLDGNAAYLSDLAATPIRSWQVRQLLARSKNEWREGGSHGFWPLFLGRRVLAASAPDWAHERRRRLRLERQGIFSREFLRRTHLADRIFASPERESLHFATRAQRAIYGLVTGGFEAHVLEWNDREEAAAGAEFRFPFFDRRLAEFCLRIPEEQRQRGAVWKLMLRNAMETRLPERVCRKMHKAEFSELFENVLRSPQTKVRLNNLHVRKHTDWLDPRRFGPHLDSLIDSGRVWPAWVILGVDLWLENALSPGSFPIAERAEGVPAAALKTNV